MTIGKRTFKVVLATLVGLVAAAYCGIVAYYVEVEPSIVYKPSHATTKLAPPLGTFAERVEFNSADGTDLVGWILRSNVQTGRWIYFLHGSAGNATTYQMYWALLHELPVNVFVPDYRGYGESQGVPSEHGLYEDAIAGYAYLLKQRNVPASNLVVYGYSLGSAVAIDLASRKQVAGLVVEGALTSVTARGQELFPYLPMSLIVRDRFDSLSKIGSVGCPKLILHARDDRAAPIHYGYELYARANAPKAFVELEGGHGSAGGVDQNKVEAALRSFFEQSVPEPHVSGGDPASGDP